MASDEPIAASAATAAAAKNSEEQIRRNREDVNARSRCAIIRVVVVSGFRERAKRIPRLGEIMTRAGSDGREADAVCVSDCENRACIGLNADRRDASPKNGSRHR